MMHIIKEVFWFIFLPKRFKENKKKKEDEKAKLEEFKRRASDIANSFPDDIPNPLKK